jgi:hypothetical protein
MSSEECLFSGAAAAGLEPELGSEKVKVQTKEIKIPAEIMKNGITYEVMFKCRVSSSLSKTLP